ncbi:hypothetical protein [Microbispora sp. NPDC049125]|uniref:hypothetical protein n=1 Tax=Microbispora sp. NPDC049125 TaxID=3154929 RepID=UPI0034660DC6
MAHSGTFAVRRAVVVRVLAVAATVLPLVMYASGWGRTSEGFLCGSLWEPSQAEVVAGHISTWAQFLLPAMVAAVLVAERYGRRWAPVAGIGLIGLVIVVVVAVAVAFPPHEICTGARRPVVIAWLPLGCYAVGAALLLASARTPLLGRAPRRGELILWTCAGLAAVVSTAVSLYGRLEPYGWSCYAAGPVRPLASDLFLMWFEYARGLAVPAGLVAVAAVVAVATRGVAPLLVAASAVLVFGFAEPVVELVWPSCGGGRLTGAAATADWPVVVAGVLVALTGLPAIRRPAGARRAGPDAPADQDGPAAPAF